MKVEHLNLIIICGIISACFGFIASQYFPMFGGIAMFGEPFSHARKTLIPGHTFLFASIGLTIGVIISITINKDKFNDNGTEITYKNICMQIKNYLGKIVLIVFILFFILCSLYALYNTIIK